MPEDVFHFLEFVSDLLALFVNAVDVSLEVVLFLPSKMDQLNDFAQEIIVLVNFVFHPDYLNLGILVKDESLLEVFLGNFQLILETINFMLMLFELIL